LGLRTVGGSVLFIFMKGEWRGLVGSHEPAVLGSIVFGEHDLGVFIVCDRCFSDN
jgi:hypothetical protein